MRGGGHLGTMFHHISVQIGFPVLTVTETADGIHIRQDRFLETGLAEPKENETIWWAILTCEFNVC